MIAVMFAMNEEAELAKQRLESKFTYKTKMIDAVAAKVSGLNALYVVCGIGKANAASATALVVNEPNIDLVVNIGVCGALRRDLQMLDVVCVSKAGYYDVDVSKFNYQPGQVPNENPFFECSRHHVEKLERLLANHSWYKGTATLGTGDTFLTEDSAGRFPALQHTAFDVVDMEGAACAQVCNKNRTPFVAIKIVSDQVGTTADGKEQYEKMARQWTERIAEVLDLVLARLA